MSSLEHELEFASAIVHALLDLSTQGIPLGVEELARRRAQATELFDASLPPSAVFSAGSRTPQLTNLSWRELLGTSPLSEAAARQVLLAIELDQSLHLDELEQEVRGQPAYLAATFRPVHAGAHPGPTGVIVVCSLITDAVMARKLGVDADALIWSGRFAQGADYFNERWLEYTGADRAATAWHPAIHADDLARCKQALGEALRLRAASEVEARVRRADGAYRWHRISVLSVVPGTRWSASAIDIDEARSANAVRAELLEQALAARADAEQANRLKDQFLATVSHELRAPLTTMLLWEKVLREDPIDGTSHVQARQAIHESVIAQARLVGDLLDVARGISGKLFIDLRAVDIVAIARDAVDAARPVADARGVTLVPRDLVTSIDVQGDAARLRQVLDNLLSNAVKFTNAGGRVDVSVRRRGPCVVIDVADTGRGVAPEFLERVFEPFSQIDDALTRRDGGLGLGLAISKQLVELHDGTLVAASAGLGRGSTLTLSLPAGRRRATSQPVGEPSPPRLDRAAILVIDDDRRVRDALALLLDRAGAAASTADSAARARDQIAVSSPDLVVCDIAMPDEDGYSFIQKLRATGSALPVIALTAHAMEADAARALAAGFDLHLAKPIDFERLLAKIDELLGARRTPRFT